MTIHCIGFPPLDAGTCPRLAAVMSCIGFAVILTIYLPVFYKDRRGFTPVLMDYSSFFSSGSPATEVSSDKIPARADALATITQLMSLIKALVPIVAIAV